MTIHYRIMSISIVCIVFMSLIGMRQLVSAASTPFVYPTPFYMTNSSSTLTTSSTTSFSSWTTSSTTVSTNLVVVSNTIPDTIPRNANGMTVPAISLWYGKVNQHFDTGSMTWETDPTGVRGAGYFAFGNVNWYGDRKLEYCQIFWPSTIAIKEIGNVFINRFMTEWNLVAYASIKPAYECVLPWSRAALNNIWNMNTWSIATGIAHTLNYTLLSRYCTKWSNGLYTACSLPKNVQMQVEKTKSHLVAKATKHVVAKKKTLNALLQNEVIKIEKRMMSGIASETKSLVDQAVHNYLVKTYNLVSRIQD